MSDPGPSDDLPPWRSVLAVVACHPSQPVPESLLWRRLDLLGDLEHLRWLQRSNPHPQKDGMSS